MKATVEFNRIFVQDSIPEERFVQLSGKLLSGKIVIDDIFIDNDSIGSYEYWGAKGIDRRPDYVADFRVVSLELEDCKTSEINVDRLTAALIEDDYFQESVFNQLREN